jgi:hypothetical protein
MKLAHIEVDGRSRLALPVDGEFIDLTDLWSAIIRAGSVRVNDCCRGGVPWHDAGMLGIAAGIISVICDAMRWLWLALRSTSAVEAENLFLRRQLALYIERGVKPRRIDSVTRIVLTILSRCFDWRDALVVVRPPERQRVARCPPPRATAPPNAVQDEPEGATCGKGAGTEEEVGCP